MNKTFKAAVYETHGNPAHQEASLAKLRCAFFQEKAAT
jgi:hypothetical protein